MLASVLRGRGLEVGEHVLVEQWRGVERPLANAASLCQVWAGWPREERDAVRLIVKRMRIRGNTSADHGGSQPMLDLRIYEINEHKMQTGTLCSLILILHMSLCLRRSHIL